MPPNPRINIVTPEEYKRQCEIDEAARRRPRTAEELRQIAASSEESAKRWRAHIEREERPGGYGDYPGWAETKAFLIELAAWCERDAAQALAEAAEREAKPAIPFPKP